MRGMVHSLANGHSCSTSAETRDRKYSAHFGGWRGGYDQSDLRDVIIFLKVIVSLFC